MARVPDYLVPLPEPNSQLGVLPIAAAASIISIAGKFVDTIHFIQYPNDKKRKASADDLLTRAAGGDAVAEADLRLLSGVGSPSDIATLRAAGIDPGCNDPSGCGWATQWAQKYGRALLTELSARRAAGAAGVTLIGQSTIPSVISATAKKAFSNPVVLIGAGVVVYLLLRKRGRR